MDVQDAVKDAPAVVFKNTESGDTFVGQEKPETIIARFIGHLLTGFNFLDNHHRRPYVCHPVFCPHPS